MDFIMKRIQISLIIFFSAVLGLVAQNTYEGTISYSASFDKVGDKIVFKGMADMSSLTLKSSQMVIVTPVFISEDGTSQVEFPYVVITGRNRTKALNREMAFGHALPQASGAAQYVRRHNGENESITLLGEAPYAAWMLGGQFFVREEIRGCAQCPIGEAEKSVKYHNPSKMDYSLALIVPQEEGEKHRSSSVDAYINFEVNKANILKGYRDNDKELAKINKFIREVENNVNYDVNKMVIEGFASPEATVEHNKDLSERRARSLESALRTKYGKGLPAVTTRFGGEDWGGLKEAVQKSNISDKARALEIINSSEYENDDVREQDLKALSSYGYMYEHFYPNLRRNTITMGYVVRDYTLEEARDIIKTSPRELSEAEMFRVAMSYPEGSAQRLNVFKTVIEFFPKSVTGRVNLAVIAFEAGDMQKVLSILDPVRNKKGVANILGAAYARLGDYAHAEECFRKAANEGDVNGQYNLDLFQGKNEQ